MTVARAPASSAAGSVPPRMATARVAARHATRHAAMTGAAWRLSNAAPLLRQRRCAMRCGHRLTHGLRGACDFGEDGELAMRITAGLYVSRRHHKLHGLLDRDVELDHVVARHV